MNGGKKELAKALSVYVLLLVVVLLVLPWVGGEHLAFREILAYCRGEDTVHGFILFRQRIPRILLAVVVGGALSMTGASLQVLFRNPLAEPWTLGVSGGAAIGAFIAHAFPVLDFRIGPLHTTQVFALAGAAGVMAMIFAVSRRRSGMGAQTLLLGGVTISVLSGGIIMLAIYFISPYKYIMFTRWMMGGLDAAGYMPLLSFLLLGAPGILLLGSLLREYNHLSLGEEMALGHGVDVRRVKWRTLAGAGLATAACVSVAGPIGFVGMIIPHVVRHFSGFDNRIVLPAAFLAGASVLALCDGVARTVLAPTEIPVGVITAVAGGPVFLYLLMRR